MMMGTAIQQDAISAAITRFLGLKSQFSPEGGRTGGLDLIGTSAGTATTGGELFRDCLGFFDEEPFAMCCSLT
jgi:hypothetical protein